MLNGYISYVRPLLKLQCHFVLVNRNGDLHGKLGEILSKLVFDAIRKYIHPTRYRQIVETQSLNQLTSEEQRILSEDQKHSSAVAKVHYQNDPDEVALEGHECLQKLQGDKGSEVDEDVHTRLGDSTFEAELSVDRVQNISSSPKRTSCLKESCALTRIFVTYVLKFTKEEDDFLKEGITKHGFGQWTAILRDDDFQFQDGRKADSLKKRAGMKIALA